MSPIQTTPKLFQPIKLGRLELKHRVAMAPLTRFRADLDGVHHAGALEYYTQRSSEPGTLIITEGTFIAPECGGYEYVPGIFSRDQIAAWKKITDAVHANGSFIYMQFWSLGRTAVPSVLAKTGHEVVSSWSKPVPDKEGAATPRPMTKEEIKSFTNKYAVAARNAMEAGFDGIEVHCANGYLFDQFIQETVNRRTDEYGGDIQGRMRFMQEVVNAVTAEIGDDRCAVRLSPWSDFQLERTNDVKGTYGPVVSWLAENHSNLSYLHVVEPRAAGVFVRAPKPGESNDFIREIWGTRPLLIAGYSSDDRKDAFAAAEKDDRTLVAFGKNFVSNPDLVKRLRNNWDLNPFDRAKAYSQGPDKVQGYIDYPFYQENKA